MSHPNPTKSSPALSKTWPDGNWWATSHDDTRLPGMTWAAYKGGWRCEINQSGRFALFHAWEPGRWEQLVRGTWDREGGELNLRPTAWKYERQPRPCYGDFETARYHQIGGAM